MPNEIELPAYLFHQGTNFRAYEFLGAHSYSDPSGKTLGLVFRVWAPKARAVSVVGDFNLWEPSANPMAKITEGGIWECYVPELHRGALYKFAVTGQKGKTVLKADPFAFHTETRPGTASVAYRPKACWHDGPWMKKRAEADIRDLPVNIYEVQLGSWRRYRDGETFDYRKTAEELSEYVKEMGYTHVEIMPVTEYPFDGSWGYQCLGYFAPTSRYGAPEDFAAFVDTMHRKGIGVIMDWVPAHFPKDEWGLANFDGSACYEYENPLMAEREEWGTKVFDFGKNEVKSFLLSSAMFWIEKYHIDGIRADAVSSMLYRDYGKQGGSWLRNDRGGKENLEAAEFLRKLNSVIAAEHPGVFTVAEESTAWPGVTKPTAEGGLGFTFKWNMGWMNDSLRYISLDPYFRAGNHSKLTFGMMYAFSEDYILPYSHDEVVHGKGTLLGKIHGNYIEKFSTLRALYAYMLGYPGKKLLFMGQEFGQFNEWNENKELDWSLLRQDSHAALKEWKKQLDLLYLENCALWRDRDGWEGFEWANCDYANENAVAFCRKDPRSGRELLFVINFSPNVHSAFPCVLPEGTSWHEILNSDDVDFGGTGRLCNWTVRTKKIEVGAQDGKTEEKSGILVRIAPFSAIIFEKVDKRFRRYAPSRKRGPRSSPFPQLCIPLPESEA